MADSRSFDSAASSNTSEHHASNVLPVLRRLLKEGYGLHARIRKLSSDLPQAFTATKSEFSPVLADFKYLKDAENEKEKLSRNSSLNDLYARSRSELSEICRRAFDILYQVVQFHKEIHEMVEDVTKNKKYVQDSMEIIAKDPDCLCALIEVLYTLGAMLLLVDRCLPGLTRERLVVAYVRHNDCIELITQNEPLQRLCKKTGYMPGSKFPQGYPENYLANFPIDEKVIHSVLDVLLTTDIYGTLKHYPNPTHRTTAMSQQAAYTYVLLYFVPDVLNKEIQVMRQVVEKFFVDRWVISWVCGHAANLRYDWDSYRAAKNALKAVLPRGRRGKIDQQHWDKVVALTLDLERQLKTGSLQTESFLRHNSDTFSLFRESNVTLRWILHHAFWDKWAPDSVDGENIAKLLLELSALELELFRMYQQLMDSRQNRIESAGNIVKDNLKALIKNIEPRWDPSTSSCQDSNMLFLLRSLCTDVDILKDSPPNEAGEKIRSIQKSFDEIVNLEQTDSTVPNSQKHLNEIRSNLVVIQQLMNIRAEVLETLKVASDFSYVGHLLENENFIKLIQSIVRRDPTNLEKFGSLLIKMRSILQGPSDDQNPERDPSLKAALFEYYESQLHSFAKNVLDHVPECVCKALDQMTIIRTLTDKLTQKASAESPPVRFGLVVKTSEEKHKRLDDTSKNYNKLAALAVDIALFSTGLIKVERCLEKVMPLKLKENLETKLRQHIAKRLSSLAHQKLQFGHTAPPFTFRNVALKGSRQIAMGQAFSGNVNGKEEFKSKIIDLKIYFDGVLHSLDCTQDCLDLPGSDLFQDELTHVIYVNLRKELKWALKGKSSKNLSKRQIGAEADTAATFLGRLVREIIRLTSPGSTHYSVKGSWLDAGGTEVFGVSSLAHLRESLGIQGIVALDTLLGARITKLMNKLHDLCAELCKIQTSGQKTMSFYARELQSCSGLSVPMDGALWYVDAVYSFGSRVWTPIIEIIAAIGQSQLLRKVISLECRNTSLLKAPVALQRPLQMLSDNFEDKDVDLISCPPSADRTSHQTNATAARYASSVASGSSFAARRSDDELGGFEGTQHPVQEDDLDATQETMPRSKFPADDPVADSEGPKPVDDTIPDSIFLQYRRQLDLENRTLLGTITEASARTERDPSMSTSMLTDTETERTTKELRGPESSYRQTVKESHHDLLDDVSADLVRKKGSEGSRSSGVSDPAWDPVYLRRQTRKAVNDLSDRPVIPSEASSRRYPFSSIDLSVLGAESFCDLFNSPSSVSGALEVNKGVYQLLQSTGLVDSMETRYIAEHLPISEVPTILFLATISTVLKYEFNKPSASLMRPLGSTVPDAKSFAYGIVAVLKQYVPSTTDQFFRHVGQYVRAYLQTATGSTAQGIAAAGVKVGLPLEAQRTVAFVCEMCEVGGWPRKRAEKFISPFLMNVWMLGT